MPESNAVPPDVMKLTTSCQGFRAGIFHVFQRLKRRHPTWRQSTSDVGHGEGEEEEGEGLRRCLGVGDLISLGVGSCCGTGIYLTAGLVASQAGAGGSALAFLLGGLASMASGLCYAELAALCPRTSGSAYMYSYVTVGEFVAYVIGWGLMLEYVIGTAAGAVSFSAAVNSMMSNSLGWPYAQLLAAGVCGLLTLVLALGVELSAKLNHVLNAVTGVVWLAFLVISAVLARPKLLTTSGAFPTGARGTLRAVPVAYYAFVGFDTVACTGDEAREPKRDIPRAILVSVLICMVAFSSVALLLTLLLPSKELHPNTAMLDALQQRGLPLMKPVLFLGAASGLLAATFGSLFPMPRVLFAMAKDKLTLGMFSYVNPKRKTAEVATIVPGGIAALLAAFVDLEILIELVLMGTLLSYILVAFCVLVMRYTDQHHHRDDTRTETSFPKIPYRELTPDLEIEPTLKTQPASSETEHLLEETADSSQTTSDIPALASVHILHRRTPDKSEDKPTRSSYLGGFLRTWRGRFSYRYDLPERVMTFLIMLTYALEVMLSLHVVYWGSEVLQLRFLPFAVMTTLASTWTVTVILLAGCGQNRAVGDGFRCPGVPFLPCVISFYNIYLMASLQALSWQLFGLWMLFGLLCYCVCALRQKSDED